MDQNPTRHTCDRTQGHRDRESSRDDCHNSDKNLEDLNASKQDPTSNLPNEASIPENLNTSEQDPTSNFANEASIPEKLNASEQDPTSNFANEASILENLNTSEQDPTSNFANEASIPEKMNASEQDPTSNFDNEASILENLNTSEQDPTSNFDNEASILENLISREQYPTSNRANEASIPENLNTSEHDPGSELGHMKAQEQDSSLRGQNPPEVFDRDISSGVANPDSSCVIPVSKNHARQANVNEEKNDERFKASDSAFDRENLQSANASEPSSNLQGAFPQLTQMLKSEKLQPRFHQFAQAYMLKEWKTDWQSEDLSFLNSHTVVILESGATRRVCAQTLSLHSTYFKAAFAFKNSLSVNVTLGWLAPLAPQVLSIVDGMNTNGCHVEISEEDSLNMFMAADFLGCEQIRNRCLQSLQRLCDRSTEEALKVYQIFLNFFAFDALIVCMKPLLRKILSLGCKGHLNKLNVHELEYLLKQDLLNCKLETDVLRIIYAWTKHRIKQPIAELAPQVDRLLCCVRFGRMAMKEISYYQNKMPLTTLPFLKERLAGAKFEESMFYQQYRAQMSDLNRKRRSQHVVLLLSCITVTQQLVQDGAERQPLARCLYLDPKTGRLLPSPYDGREVSHVVDPELAGTPYLESEAYSTSEIFCIASGSDIYVVGGYWSKCFHRKVLHFDRQQPQLGWRVCSQLTSFRLGHCCAVAQGFLYAIGGVDDENKTLKSVERLPVDKRSNLWSEVEPLLFARNSAAAVEHRGSVFVVGGCFGLESLHSAEIYCPMSGTWTLVSRNMSYHRAGLCAVVVGDAVFAVCGYDENKNEMKRSLERWREHEGWDRYGQKVQEYKHMFSCVAIDERILVFGGATSRSTEFIDIEDDIAGTGSLRTMRRKALKELFRSEKIRQPIGRMCACILDVNLD